MNRKILVSALVGGLFLTVFTGWVVSGDENSTGGIFWASTEGVGRGFPFAWNHEIEANVEYHLFEFLADFLIWFVVALILLLIFMRFGIPF